MTTPNTQGHAGVDAAAFAGHTPGPWQAEGNNEFRDWFVGPVMGGQRIAEVFPSVNGPRRTAANARLIAAAPSLLAEVVSLRAKLAASEASRAELVGALEGLANRVYGHGHGDPWALLGDVRAALADTQEGGAK